MTEIIPYEREIVFQNEDAELVKVTWPKGSSSVAHDHGESHGLIRILEGEIYQKIFDKETKRFLTESVHGKGEVFLESPDMIHIMGNSSSEKVAVTLHYYSPRLKMESYDLE